MHLPESSLDAHIDGRKVGVRSHDPDHAAGRRVQTGSNDTEDNILTGEDTSNGAVVLDEKGRGVMLLHQVRGLLDRGANADGDWRLAIEDRLERGARHLDTQSLHIRDDLLGLAGAQLGLHTLERIVQLARGRVGPLQLLHGVVKALCNVEDTRNILVLVHDRQVAEALAHHEVECIGSAGVGPGAQRVLGHDFGNGNIGGLQAQANYTESQILGGKDTRDSVIVVGNQNTVFPLGSHQLCGLGNGGLGLDLQGLTGLEGEDGARRGLAGVSSTASQVLLLGEVILQLATDSLGRNACC